MLKSCPYCQRIHDSKIKCNSKIKYKKQNNKMTIKDKFRSTSAWQKKREEIKERDYFLCRICLYNKKINRLNLQVHHIESLQEDYNKRLDDDNLITLCQNCHEQAEKGHYTKDFLKKLIKAGVNIPPYV